MGLGIKSQESCPTLLCSTISISALWIILDLVKIRYNNDVEVSLSFVNHGVLNMEDDVIIIAIIFS